MKPNKQRRMPTLRDKQRRRPSANSLTRKRLERQPKSARKPAKTPPKANEVSAGGCDGGSDVNLLIRRVRVVPQVDGSAKLLKRMKARRIACALMPLYRATFVSLAVRKASVGVALVKLTVMCIIRCAGSRRMSHGNPSFLSKRGAASLSGIASA